MTLDAAEALRDMSAAYWCLDWYPARADERPCDCFFTGGLYLRDVDAHDQPLEPVWEEDPNEVACREHDTGPEKISTAEWDARLVRARTLATARAWRVPEPEPWDEPTAIGPVIGNWGGECRAGRSGYESCHEMVRIMAIERAGRIYRKAICAGALYRATHDPDSFALADLARTSHVNRCLPYLPPNH